MSVAPRKLQRLGLSSLVVTLPRRWVEAHGLKPGDLVYVIDEGDRLRIVPAQPSEARRSYRFDAYKLAMPQLASAALTCLYVNNINDVVMDLKGMGEEGLKYLKQTSMRLLGLEVTQLDSERASVRIVLDDSRADPKMAIKGLGSAVGNIAELLRRASSGEALGSDEVEVATAELLKYQHLIMRHVVSSVSEGVIDTRVQGTIVGTAVLGVVGNVLLEALKLAQRWSLRSSRVAEVAGQLRDLIPMVSAMVAQPSVKRLHEASLTALSLSAWL
ncbi:MAG: AbrB/MazE/SpoVT family DNA-binding domain-containing protein, partial [Acidilobus sp.]|nr:AbrB/MazE/SpoVT family DNA-binding domain-containing protein [Acidilobus sp.]